MVIANSLTCRFNAAGFDGRWEVRSMQIEAAVAHKAFGPLDFESLELEEPRHDEVRVRLVATGVCHTDMAVRDQKIVPMPQPIVLGHEGAGIVESVGASVAKVKVGDHVILSGDFLRYLSELPDQFAILLL